MSDISYTIIRSLGYPIYWITARRTILHAERLRRPGAFILASNHLSPYDVPALMGASKRRLDFVSITEMLRNPMVAAFFRAVNCEFVDRSRPDAYLNLARIYNAQQASDKALEVLRAALPAGKEFPATEYYQGVQADLAVERGVAYTAKKMYAPAIEEYVRALDLDPRRAVIHRRLAELYRQKGDPAGAALHTKEADKLEKGQR